MKTEKYYTKNQMRDYALLALHELALLNPNPDHPNPNSCLPDLPISFTPPTKPVDITEYDTGNTAWPFKDVLTKLVEASDILLHKRDYDGHGWEEHELCFRLAKAILTKLMKGEKP